MVHVASVPAPKLPEKHILRSTLKSPDDVQILQDYLQMLAQQPARRDNGLRRLLQTCAELGHQAFVEILLDAGASVDATNSSSLPPVFYAVQGGHVAATMTLLSRGASIRGTYGGDRTLVMQAAAIGNLEILELLLQKNAEVSGMDKQGRSAVIHAASAGSPSVLKALLERSADVQRPDSSGKTATMYAAERGNVQTMKLLLELDADISAWDVWGMTAVMFAASNKNAEVLKILLTRGADHRVADLYGKTALMHAASSGNAAVLELLLDHGASLSGVDANGKTPLMYAVSNKDTDVLKILLERGANFSDADESLRCLKEAALSGRDEALRLFSKKKANFNAVDRNGRTPLLYLASSTMKPIGWSKETVNILLEAGSDPEKADKDLHTHRSRTALQWAAVTGHYDLAQAILGRVEEKQARKLVNAKTSRGKAALHLAAEHDQARMVGLLLNNGASVDATSEGSWTPLLIAAKKGHIDVVEALLSANVPKRKSSRASDTMGIFHVPANVNARTSSGMTALHWAAENGHTKVIKRILEEDNAWKNPKDSFHTTPLLRAGQHRHLAVIEQLKGYIFGGPHGGPPNRHASNACKDFTAVVVDFHLKAEIGEQDRFALKSDKAKKTTHSEPKIPVSDRNEVRRMSVMDVLYSMDQKDKTKFAVTTKLDEIQKGAPDFRWIHLPANNLAWAEVLITKMFIEGGPIDISGFRAMLRIFGQQQHRGSKVHSRFMRPVCQHHVCDNEPSNPSQPPDPRAQGSTTVVAPTSPTKEKAVPSINLPPTPISPTKVDKTTPATPPSVPTKKVRKSSGSDPFQLNRNPNDVAVLFMPYLHWEEDSSRLIMSNTLSDRLSEIKGRRQLPYDAKRGKDESLIRGYLHQSTDLHPRRTLDQFKHHSINTDKRDRDQVVYRYYRYHREPKSNNPKVFMVDQMWIWVFNGILITCFPERWGQPLRDALNLFDGVIEDLNSKTLPPVKSTYELAALITSRCTGAFDRHEWGYEGLDYMFFEMFELSIGTLTRRATALLERFQRDSTAAARWLKAHDRANLVSEKAPEILATTNEDVEDVENAEDDWLKDPQEKADPGKVDPNPVFVNRLLNISKEAQLLVECKDIEDELSILTAVLEQQRGVLQDMGKTMYDLSTAHGARRSDMPKKAGIQKRLVDQHLLDLERMRVQTKRVNESLAQVLDLKQKHANALETRFARDQAQATARQGQTIMVFTIVTIIFLPLSFMAAVFAIDIIDYPLATKGAGPNTRTGLHLGFVCQYMFGIGFAVSVPLIAVAFLFGDPWSLKKWLGLLHVQKSSKALKTAAINEDMGKLTELDSEEYTPRRPTHVDTSGTIDSGFDIEANRR